MASPQFSPEFLTKAFPGLAGFRYMAAGSYKSVYHVTRADGSSDEVLKVVRLPITRKTEEEEALYQQELGRVQRETAILGKCTSPFVVKMGKLLPQTIEVDNCPCFAYTEELLSGNDLSSVINFNANKPADESEVKRLLRCLVSAVQTLWRDHRVVHRDIKPANVFATRDPARPYVLIDLGIAYDVSVPGLTLRKTDIPHTPLYMAPEMLSADFRETMSYRSDLYAAGLCAYEYAAGVHPLAKQGDDLRRTYTRVIHQEPTPLQQLRPDLSPDFCQLIDQLLKKSPSLRPANMNLILNQIA